MKKLKPMDRKEIEGIVSDAISDAVDFIESEVSEDREKAQRYFNGEVDMGHERGRSSVISTKCRDVVRTMKPLLMRVFMAADNPVEFVPMSQDDVQGAEQATAYASWKFNQKNGYRLINDVFHDALIKKVGILKATYKDEEKVEIDDYTGLTDDQFAMIAGDGVEILEHDEYQDTITDPASGVVVPVVLHDAKVSYEVPAGDIHIESIPPEEFFVNPGATCIEDATICGHKNPDMTVGDLVAMGYDYDEVVPLVGADEAQEESDHNRSGFSMRDAESSDPAMQKVLVTEAYILIDADGTGVPVLHQAICVGTSYKLLDYQKADEKPFAVFEVDPEPHTFFGRSLVDIVINDQDAATSMLRGILDNVALCNTPGLDVIETQVNMEDLLNNEVGAIRRVKSLDAIRPNNIPFTAGATLPAMQYYDDLIDNKTGVTRASTGLDPDVLQNATAAAVNATVSGATAQPEIMARNLAEGGMKQLFRLLVKLARQHPDQETTMRLDGDFVPVDPRSWNVDLDLSVNVGLGTGGKLEREKALRDTLMQQTQILTTMGLQNPLVTLTQYRHTLADIQKLGGVHNSDRYYQPITPEIEQQLAQQAAQAAQNQPDPNASLIQAELNKAQIQAQSRIQVESMKAQQKSAMDAAKLAVRVQEINQADDLQRDKMIQELAIEAGKLLGEYGKTLDVEQIRASQQVN